MTLVTNPKHQNTVRWLAGRPAGCRLSASQYSNVIIHTLTPNASNIFSDDNQQYQDQISQRENTLTSVILEIKFMLTDQFLANESGAYGPVSTMIRRV